MPSGKGDDGTVRPKLQAPDENQEREHIHHGSEHRKDSQALEAPERGASKANGQGARYALRDAHLPRRHEVLCALVCAGREEHPKESPEHDAHGVGAPPFGKQHVGQQPL